MNMTLKEQLKEQRAQSIGISIGDTKYAIVSIIASVLVFRYSIIGIPALSEGIKTMLYALLVIVALMSARAFHNLAIVQQQEKFQKQYKTEELDQFIFDNISVISLMISVVNLYIIQKPLFALGIWDGSSLSQKIILSSFVLYVIVGTVCKASIIYWAIKKVSNQPVQTKSAPSTQETFSMTATTHESSKQQVLKEAAAFQSEIDSVNEKLRYLQTISLGIETQHDIETATHRINETMAYFEKIRYHESKESLEYAIKEAIVHLDKQLADVILEIENEFVQNIQKNLRLLQR